MSYGGKGYERQDLPSEKSHGIRDAVFILGTLGAAGTIAAIVITGTIIGGGALLLVGLPLFLLFSPILVPGGIIATVLGGGALAFVAFIAGSIGVISWLYNYFTGRHPFGADQVDQVTGRVKGVVDYGREKTSEALGYGQHKAGEVLGYGQHRAGDVMGYGGQKAQEAGGYVQHAAQQAKQGSGAA